MSRVQAVNSCRCVPTPHARENTAVTPPGVFFDGEIGTPVETQRKTLEGRLSKLTHDYASEEQKRRELEEDVVRARSNRGVQRGHASDAGDSRLHEMEGKFNAVRAEYRGRLEILADMRAHLEKIRSHHGKGGVEENMGHDERHVAGGKRRVNSKLTEMDREVIIEYQQAIERFSKKSTKRLRNQMTFGSRGTQVVQSVGNDHQTSVIQILESVGVADLLDLFTETERLERENVQICAFIAQKDEARQNMSNEIASFEDQVREMTAENEMGCSVDQKSEMEQLNLEIASMQTRLADVEIMRQQVEKEGAEMYPAIEKLFDTLRCSRDGAPDEFTNVNAKNAIFAMRAIENSIVRRAVKA